MTRSVPWLIAGTLVAAAAVVSIVELRNSSEATGGPAESSVQSAPEPVADERITELAGVQVADQEQAPLGLGARLLTDSEGSRQHLLARTIREAGFDCPEARSADAVAAGGDAWRVYCGALRLFWVEIDEFGRMSVEPGAYDESNFGIGDGAGGRTITIQQEDLEGLTVPR